jgi:hypothetical protein
MLVCPMVLSRRGRRVLFTFGERTFAYIECGAVVRDVARQLLACGNSFRRDVSRDGCGGIGNSPVFKRLLAPRSRRGTWHGRVTAELWAVWDDSGAWATMFVALRLCRFAYDRARGASGKPKTILPRFPNATPKAKTLNSSQLVHQSAVNQPSIPLTIQYHLDPPRRQTQRIR